MCGTGIAHTPNSNARNRVPAYAPDLTPLGMQLDPAAPCSTIPYVSTAHQHRAYPTSVPRTSIAAYPSSVPHISIAAYPSSVPHIA
eukprot:3940978-Rhodomonas_salina.2